jgi:hypothetical protein
MTTVERRMSERLPGSRNREFMAPKKTTRTISEPKARSCCREERSRRLRPFPRAGWDFAVSTLDSFGVGVCTMLMRLVLLW